jgi:hypothetical protein
VLGAIAKKVSMRRVFELTILSQKRVITALILFPVMIFLVIIISAELNPAIGFLSFTIFLFTLYYFAIGKLTVSIENEIVQFQWTKKTMFNYDDISSVHESDIKKVIIDNGQFLRQIITKDRIIKISTSKLKPKDACNLISYFNEKSKTQNIVINNSWESISPKKLRLASYLTWTLLIAAILTLIFVTISSGFKPQMLFILGPIAMLFNYIRQIKNAIKRNNSNSA